MQRCACTGCAVWWLYLLAQYDAALGTTSDVAHRHDAAIVIVRVARGCGRPLSQAREVDRYTAYHGKHAAQRPGRAPPGPSLLPQPGLHARRAQRAPGRAFGSRTSINQVQP